MIFDALFLKDIPGSHFVIFFFFFNLSLKVFCQLRGFFLLLCLFFLYCQQLEHREHVLSLLILFQDLSHRFNKCLLND